MNNARNDWEYSLFKSTTIVITSECLRIINMEKAVSRRQTSIPTYSRAYSFGRWMCECMFTCQSEYCSKPQVFLHNMLFQTHDYFHFIYEYSFLRNSQHFQIFQLLLHITVTFPNCVVEFDVYCCIFHGLRTTIMHQLCLVLFAKWLKNNKTFT